MLLEELKKIMPDASSEVLAANLKIINDDAQVMVETEVKGLKENKTKLLTQMEKLKGNQLPEGYDADGYTNFLKDKGELAKKQKELDDKTLEDKGQWDALKLQLNETHTTAITSLTGEKDAVISGLTKALNKELIENASIKAIEAEKGNSLFLLPHMLGNIETVQAEDGTYGVQVVDKEGNQRFGDDATTPFSVTDLVNEMKANDSFAPAFPEQNGGGGGNANAGGKGGAGVNPWKAETKNITEQGRIIKENPSLAAQFKKAAGVSE